MAFAIRSADLGEIWQGLTAGKQRGLLHLIETARTAPTRTKRIGGLRKSLADLR